MNPLISVIMGAYNCAATLPRAIDSIQRQDLRDWEMIICNDGSSDDTLTIAMGIALKDERVRVISNDHNLGLARTLNRCIEVSAGEFIARMDADDECHPARFSTQLAVLRKNPEASFVGTGASFCDNAGQWGTFIPKQQPLVQDLISRTQFVHPSVMIRKVDLVAVHGYCESPRYNRVEDLKLWFDMYSLGKFGINTPDILFYYQNGPDSIARRNISARWNEARLKLEAVRSCDTTSLSALWALKPFALALLPKNVYTRMYRNKYASRSS